MTLEPGKNRHENITRCDTKNRGETETETKRLETLNNNEIKKY